MNSTGHKVSQRQRILPGRAFGEADSVLSGLRRASLCLLGGQGTCGNGEKLSRYLLQTSQRVQGGLVDPVEDLTLRCFKAKKTKAASRQIGDVFEMHAGPD